MNPGRIVVLTALPLEATAVRAYLPQRTNHTLRRGTIVECATLADTGFEVCLATTGTGIGRAAVVAERVISWAEPTAVLLVGIAGALKDEARPGDVVVATRVSDYESGKDTSDGFYQHADAWPGAHRLQQAAQQAEAEGAWRRRLTSGAHPVPAVHFKPIVYGNVLKDSADSVFAQRLRTAFSDAVAIEMEACGVAHAAEGTDLLVIRAISDRSDGTKFSSDAAGGQLAAAQHAAAFAFGVIEALTAPAMTAGAPLAAEPAPSVPPAPEPDWTPVEPAVAVRWRGELAGGYVSAPATLEVHLVPVGADARLQAAALRDLPGELVRRGREAGMFDQSQAVEPYLSVDVALASARDPRGAGSQGLAMLRTGQRTAWVPLPKSRNMSVPLVDPEQLAERMSALLEVLLALPGAMAQRVVPVAAIEPAMHLTHGMLAVQMSGGVTLRSDRRPMRTESTQSLSTTALLGAVRPVAVELAAQLDMAYGPYPR